MMRQLRLFHLETALTHEHERRQRLEWYLRELMFERQTLQDGDEPSLPSHIDNNSATATVDVDSDGLTSGLDLNSYELGSGMVLADTSSNNNNSLTSYLTSPRKVTVSPAEIFGSATIDSNPITAAEYSQSLAVCAAKLNKKLGSSTGTLPLAVQPSIRKSTSAAAVGRRRIAQQHRLSIRKLAKSSFMFIRKFDSDRACESDDNDDYEDGNSDAEPIEEEGEEASAEEEEDEFTTGSTDADDESELTSQESNDSAEVKAQQDSDLAVIQRWERMLKASQQKDKESSRQLRPRRKLASSFDSVGCSSSSPVSSSPSSPVTFSFEQPAIEI